MIALILASLALSSLHAETLVSMESLLDRPVEQRVVEFRKLGLKAHKFLATTAFEKTESLQARWRSITTMGRLDAIGYRAQIDRALVSPEWFMRNAALIALLADERTRAVSWSVRMLEDRALVVRTQAVRNLIGLNAAEAEPMLWKQIGDRRNYKGEESLWIRGHIAEALARLTLTNQGSSRTREFQRLLMDPDERLHRWAILGLENSTGYKLSDRKEPTEIQRQKWLARLGVEEI